MTTSPDSASVTRAEWGVLVCLAAILALEILGWSFTRANEAQASLAASSPGTTTATLHVFLNRGASPAIDRTQVEALLASDETLLREMVMTSDVWRLAGRAAQREHLEGGADPGEAVRGRYYLKWHGQPVRRSSLRAYFRSLEPSE